MYHLEIVLGHVFSEFILFTLPEILGLYRVSGRPLLVRESKWKALGSGPPTLASVSIQETPFIPEKHGSFVIEDKR